MAQMSIPYERRFTDAVVNGIVRRARNTQDVLTALGPDAPAMPKYSTAQYEADTTELQTKSVGVNNLLTQLISELTDIDALAAVLKKKNEAFLPLLKGAVMGTANENLLEQIMGAAKRGPHDDPEPTSS